ncbi:MAG: rod shape-determining protein MreC [Flavobacteriaceae bacterium]|jgi:rod shape-determining protein MreC
MQRIIEVLLAFKNELLYGILLLFSLFFLTQRSFYHQAQFTKLSLYVTGNILETRQNFVQYLHLKTENEQLILENEKLKASALQFNEQKTASSNATQDRFPFLITPAKVINNQHQKMRNYALVNKGIKEGISVEMGVIGNQGVLGIVEEVSPHYASVISLLNVDFGLNVRLKKNATFGSLRWEGKSPYTMQLNDIVATTPLALGDTVVTSGRSSYFPGGIPVGTISSIDKETVQGYYNLEVALFQSPIEMENIYVVKNSDREEIERLIENQPHE